MFICHVLRKVCPPSFIHAYPGLFSMHCSIFILILADTTDECCLLRADGSTMTLETIQCDSSISPLSLSFGGHNMRTKSAPRQSIVCHQSCSRLLEILQSIALSGSNRPNCAILIVNQLLGKQGIEKLLRLLSARALAVGIPIVYDADS